MTRVSSLCYVPAYLWSWWRHQMETFSALLALCAGNSLVTGEFLAQRPVTHSFCISFIWAWINGWVNNLKAGDLRHHRDHCNVTVWYQVNASQKMKACVCNNIVYSPQICWELRYFKSSRDRRNDLIQRTAVKYLRYCWVLYEKSEEWVDWKMSYRQRIYCEVCWKTVVLPWYNYRLPN